MSGEPERDALIAALKRVHAVVEESPRDHLRILSAVLAVVMADRAYRPTPSSPEPREKL